LAAHRPGSAPRGTDARRIASDRRTARPRRHRRRGTRGGEVARELQEALSEVRSGASLPAALDQIAERTSLAPLARFLDGIVIALERGTPLADVLRAQAGDAREAGKRALLTTGGRREVAMMLPVVFLILPITVVFALYPGLINISILTR
jgi:tight adherence protein C